MTWLDYCNVHYVDSEISSLVYLGQCCLRLAGFPQATAFHIALHVRICNRRWRDGGIEWTFWMQSKPPTLMMMMMMILQNTKDFW